MKAHIELSSTPIEEDCTQTTDPDYKIKGYRECQAYERQLVRHYVVHHRLVPGDVGVKLRVKTNRHDFCTYYEVAAFFDDSDEKATEAAFWLEANQPLHWDAEARKELRYI